MKKWDEMTARERDALVAEKVMGLSVYRHNENIPFVKSRKILYDPSPYTTDISAAWEVVQRMKPTHFMEMRVGGICESVMFTPHKGGRGKFAQCSTAQESICLAALRAVGVEV